LRIPNIKTSGIMQLLYIHPILGDYIANPSLNVSLTQQVFMNFWQKKNK